VVVSAPALAILLVTIRMIASLEIALAWTATLFAPPPTGTWLLCLILAVLSGESRAVALAEVASLYGVVYATDASVSTRTDCAQWNAISAHKTAITFTMRLVPRDYAL
jgi:hypothetical protein